MKAGPRRHTKSSQRARKVFRGWARRNVEKQRADVAAMHEQDRQRLLERLRLK
jgi:hypothetical protein